MTEEIYFKVHISDSKIVIELVNIVLCFFFVAVAYGEWMSLYDVDGKKITQVSPSSCFPLAIFFRAFDLTALQC